MTSVHHLPSQKGFTYRNECTSFFTGYRVDILKVRVSSGKRIVWGTLQVGDCRVSVLGKRQGLPYIIRASASRARKRTHAPFHGELAVRATTSWPPPPGTRFDPRHQGLRTYFQGRTE